MTEQLEGPPQEPTTSDAAASQPVVGADSSSKTRLPLAIQVPKLGDDVARLLRQLEDSPEDVWAPDRVSAAAAAQAKAAIPVYAALCTRASVFRERVILWLAELNCAIPFPLAPLSLTQMLNAVMVASGDLPAIVFNKETLAQAMRSTERISTKAIDAVVRPEARAIAITKSHLERIVRARAAAEKAAAEAADRPDQGERDSVLARFRADMQDLQRAPGPDAPQTAPPKRETRPHYLTLEQRLELAERDALVPDRMQEVNVFVRDALRLKVAAAKVRTEE
jgi:hypothetical protein